VTPGTNRGYGTGSYGDHYNCRDYISNEAIRSKRQGIQAKARKRPQYPVEYTAADAHWQMKLSEMC